jgi:TetR/AcrR family transcriptional repressor of nem operon
LQAESDDLDVMGLALLYPALERNVCGCTLAARVSEIGRQDAAIGAAYAEGFRQLTDMVQQALPAGVLPDEARRRAIALVSGMVGGLVIARALEKADPDLSKVVLAAAREELERLAFATRRVEKSG